jgi:hypothetical protein
MTTKADIEKLLSYGRIGLETGYYEQARECFEQVLALDAANFEAKKGLREIDTLLERRRASVEPVEAHPVERSIPFLCRHGFHKWTVKYVKQDSCETQEVCSRCGLTQGRVDVIHEWEWVFPKPNSCIKQKVCRRCKAIGHTDDTGSRRWRRVCVDGAAREKFLTLQQSLADLAKSARIWYIAATEETGDWKRHAGASSLVTRNAARGTKEFLPHTNILMYGISFDSKHLFFFPDKVSVFQGQSPVFSDPAYISASYDGLKVQFSALRFRETDPVPNDSQAAGYTWKYVRVDGGPDRRYAYNQRIPIVIYGQVEFPLQTGLNLQFLVSNLAYAEAFVRSLSKYIRALAIPGSRTSEKNESRQREQTRTKTKSRLESKDPYEVLGVRPSASMSEIAAAYRKLAQENHPDKVAGLAPEFRELAERRMKVINAAYEELKRKKR